MESNTQVANETQATPKADGPILKLTPAAVAQVKQVMEAQGWNGHTLSIRVVPAGCSGLGYDLNLVPDSKPGDILWEQDGIRIATDGMSGKYLAGTEIDFVTSVQAAGFKFNNPNAQTSCGCGQTFSA